MQGGKAVDRDEGGNSRPGKSKPLALSSSQDLYNAQISRISLHMRERKHTLFEQKYEVDRSEYGHAPSGSLGAYAGLATGSASIRITICSRLHDTH